MVIGNTLCNTFGSYLILKNSFMANTPHQYGRQELINARNESRWYYWGVGLFSCFANLLLLTGPIYMLQIYDRVLGSRSEATLVALSLVVVFLYAVMGLLDFSRGRVMARVGTRFQARLDRRVFDAMLRRSATQQDPLAASAANDLEMIQRLMTSPVLMAFFDLPWTPIFLLGISLFHPWLGALALSGGAILIVFALLNQLSTRKLGAEAAQATFRASQTAEHMRSEAEMIRTLNMSAGAFNRWQSLRNSALVNQLKNSDFSGGFTVGIKTFRLFLQSAMLGLGAYLVLQEELTPGAMIAGSILLGRALAPIELAVGQWALVQRGRKGWQNLSKLLSETPPETPRTPLPVPQARLDAQALTVFPPGEQTAALKSLTFSIPPGSAVGVIGPSGAGKSTLARTLTGVWQPAGGKIRLDGAPLDNYAPEVLGEHIGYLPQRVQLFDGTIAENIARLSPNRPPEQIVQAAQKAAAHEMILSFPDGYDTQVSAFGGKLSGGQIQRIGLARALCGDPVIVVLDEPNSNLDHHGGLALNAAIRSLKADGKTVLIMAHRPAAIQECNLLLMLDGGQCKAFGPKEEVLKSTVQNYQALSRPQTETEAP